VSITSALLASKRASDPAAVLHHITPHTQLIVPIANGEPVTLLDAIEEHAAQLEGVTVHQMHALHDRPTLHGAFGDRLHHVSYFLSHITRPCFLEGAIDLVPNHFSEVYDLMMRRATRPYVLASVSPPDRHGNFSLGTSSDYVSSAIGRVPFFVEVNRQMPRTYGRNQIHVSQVDGWVDADYPLVVVEPTGALAAAALFEAQPGQGGELVFAVAQRVAPRHVLPGAVFDEVVGVVDQRRHEAVAGDHRPGPGAKPDAGAEDEDVARRAPAVVQIEPQGGPLRGLGAELGAEEDAGPDVRLRGGGGGGHRDRHPHRRIPEAAKPTPARENKAARSGLP
jgi:hypothetical protein